MSELNIIDWDPILLVNKIMELNPGFNTDDVSRLIREAIRDNALCIVKSKMQEVGELWWTESLPYYFTTIYLPELSELLSSNDLMSNIMIDLPSGDSVNVYISNEGPSD